MIIDTVSNNNEMVKVSLKTLHYKNKIIKKSINSNLIFILDLGAVCSIYSVNILFKNYDGLGM